MSFVLLTFLIDSVQTNYTCTTLYIIYFTDDVCTTKHSKKGSQTLHLLAFLFLKSHVFLNCFFLKLISYFFLGLTGEF